MSHRQGKGLGDKELRFAVLGTGFWSAFQIPAWFEVEGVRLAALYNRTVSRAERAAAFYRVPKVYADPEEMLQKESLDFIDIITEVPAHAPLVFLAARYGVPVICQKPMGPDYPTCEAMVSAAREAGIPFLIHENFRWSQPMRAVKKALDEGWIGPPFLAHLRMSSGPEESYMLQPFLKTLEQPALNDMGSHVFDLVRFLFGEAESIYCATHKSLDFLSGPNIFTATLRCGPALCVCEVGCRVDSSLLIEGPKGVLELGTDRTLHIRTDAQEIVRPCPPTPRYAWGRPEAGDPDILHAIVECHRHLVASLRTGQPAESAGEENLKTMRLMFAAIESAQRGEVVRV